MRGALSALRKWFEQDVGEFVDYLPNGKLSNSFKT
jgi:hypothetical protein